MNWNHRRWKKITGKKISFYNKAIFRSIPNIHYEMRQTLNNKNGLMDSGHYETADKYRYIKAITRTYLLMIIVNSKIHQDPQSSRRKRSIKVQNLI